MIPLDYRQIVPDNKQGHRIQIIPNHVILTIYNHGKGKNPVDGNFIYLRQKTFLPDQTIVSEGRKIYSKNRGRLIKGFQYAMGFAKEGMIAMLQLSPEYGYGNSKKSIYIPQNTRLFMQFQILSINEMINEQKDLLIQVVALGKLGDKQLEQSNWQEAYFYYKRSMNLIYTTKTKDLQKYHSKVIIAIHIKAIEISLVIQEYYQVIIWGYMFLEQYQNQKDNIKRCILARSRAFTQIGQFQLAKIGLEQLILLNYHDQQAKKQLQRVEHKKQSNNKKNLIKSRQSGKTIRQYMANQQKIQEIQIYTNKSIDINQQKSS